MSGPRPTPEAAAEHLAFRAGGAAFCLPVAAVREVRRWTPTTRLPHAPDHVLGVTNLRGEVVPVVDLAARAGLPAAAPTPRHAVIVIEAEGRLFGALVEQVEDIVTVGGAARAPALGPEAGPAVVAARATVGGRMTQIVDPAALSPLAEADP